MTVEDAMLKGLRRDLQILINAGGVTREMALDALMDVLSMDDLDALKERLP